MDNFIDIRILNAYITEVFNPDNMVRAVVAWPFVQALLWVVTCQRCPVVSDSPDAATASCSGAWTSQPVTATSITQTSFNACQTRTRRPCSRCRRTSSGLSSERRQRGYDSRARKDFFG